YATILVLSASSNIKMKFLLITTLLVVASQGTYIVKNPYHRYAISRQTREQPTVFKSLGDFFHRMHAAANKRCAYLLDEACNNGGIPGAGSDNDWLNQGFTPGKRDLNRLGGNWLTNTYPGKRCVNTMDESCSNGGIPGAGSDNDWLGGGFTPGKRCANVMDESCGNGGIPGSGSDRDWLDGGFTPGKRCANVMDESCSNGGIPGSGSDKDWLEGGFTPGKRCANVMDESCGNGGIPGSGSDRDWLDGGFTPGKRSINLKEAEGVPGAGNDRDWLHGDNTPGRR
ncbi:hypothetical protein NQ315_010291, partial [Exocentrus adspersus]